jgi:hypothetical protein
VDKHRGKLGEIVQLQAGSVLERCGDGYDERTAKVHHVGSFYFVFLQDICGSRKEHGPGT